MKRLLITFTAMVLASCASARVMPGVYGAIPYTPPANQRITMGAETLYGFGGYHLTGVSFANVRNGLGAPTNDITRDLSSDVIPVVSGESYGGAAPTWTCPAGWPTAGECDYTATLSDGLSSGTLTIVIVPNSSTVKSHFGFANGRNPDTPTSYQLGTVLGSASNIHLGDTIVIRAGSGETGPTPAINPVNLINAPGQPANSQRYYITPPETSSAVSYTATGGGSYVSPSGSGEHRIRIQCEGANTATDPNGDLIRGGNCDIGGLVFNSTYDVSLPYDFYNIYLFDNHIPATGETAYPKIIDYKSLGYGASFYNARAEFGPNFTPAYQREIRAVLFNTRRGTFMNSHLLGGVAGISEVYPAGANNPRCTIEGNTFEGMVADGVDYGPGGGCDASINFFFNFARGDANPTIGDQLVINGTAYPFVANAVTPGSIPLATNGHVTAFNAACTINGGGTVNDGGVKTCVPGVNYPAGETADPNVSAVSAASGTVYLVTLTAKVAGVTMATHNSIWNLSSNPVIAAAAASSTGSVSFTIASAGGSGVFTFNTEHRDTFQYVGGNVQNLNANMGITRYNISVRNVDTLGVADRQFYFFSNISAGSTLLGGDLRWNISNLTAGNMAYLIYANGVIDSYNTNLSDVNSTAFTGPGNVGYDSILPATWYGSMSRGNNVVISDGGGGGTFNNNLSNSGGWSVQTGTAVNGNPAGTVSIGNNQFINWLGATTSGATVGAYYNQVFPGYPASSPITTEINPAVVLGIWAPARGAVFVGSVAGAALSSMTVSCSSPFVPPVNMPINGPGILNGNVVTSVSACNAGTGFITIGLLNATTGAGSGNYGTGAMNGDGTYNGALLPMSNDGQIRRNDGQVFDPTSTAGTVYPIAAPATP